MIRTWLNDLGTKTLFIELGRPRENGYIESFNGKLRDELPNHEIFYTLQEAKILIEQWRREYNQVRPHSVLGYRPPAPEPVLMPTITTTLRTALLQTLTHELVLRMGSGHNVAVRKMFRTANI